VFLHHAHRALADFRGKLRGLVHGSILSRVGASSNPGAVHSITHTIEREPSKLIEAVSGDWPKVLSNLKSLLETGAIALQEPYPTQSANPGEE
jgi:hypothetical protein